MWISKIELINFKVYKNATLEFNQPSPGKNIVLIGAINGHGKTSLLESIYIGLYGKDALPYLERAGIKLEQQNSLSWSNWLNSALYHGARNIQKRFVEASITIEIKKNQNSGVRVKRTFHFNRVNDTFKHQDSDDRIEIFEIKSNMLERVNPELEQLILEKFAVPSSIAPLFFFDGEKLSDRLSNSNQKFIENGLYQLCGIDLLNRVISDLEGPYITHCINEQSLPKNHEIELSKLNNSISNLSPEVNLLKLTIDQKNELVNNIKKDYEKILAEIISYTNGDSKTSKEYAEAQRQAQEQKNSKTSLIHKSLGNSLAQALVPFNLIDSFIKTQKAEIIRLNHEAGKSQAEHRLPEFIENLRNDPDAKSTLGTAFLGNSVLEKAIRSAWTGLFHPLPKGCAENIWHNYLTTDAHADITNSLKNWGQNLPNIPQLIKDANKAADAARIAADKIKQLDNTPIEDLVEKNKLIQKELETEQRNLGGLNQNFKIKQEQLTREKANREILLRKIREAEPSKVKSERARNVIDCIEKIKLHLINSKIENVGIEATRIFKLIAHDLQVHSISFNNGEIVPKDSKGNTINLGLSAGERQIQVMSILGALGAVSSYIAPIVIDTPLARLDVKHRNNLWNYWSSLPHQVIILAQDSEINPNSLTNKIQNINSIFTINSTSNETDGYKTAAITTNKYFENSI